MQTFFKEESFSAPIRHYLQVTHKCIQVIHKHNAHKTVYSVGL